MKPLWKLYYVLRRRCETSEVVNTVCFLLSQDASFIASTDLPLDGGYMSISAERLREHPNFSGTDYLLISYCFNNYLYITIFNSIFPIVFFSFMED